MMASMTITGYMTISEGRPQVLGLRQLVKTLQDEAILVAAGYPSTRTVWLIIDGVPRQARPSTRSDQVRWRVTPTWSERRYIGDTIGDNIGFDVPIVSPTEGLGR